MSEKRYVVPEGMLKAVMRQLNPNPSVVASSEAVAVYMDSLRGSLEAALRWLAENPIVPTEAQLLKMQRERGLVPNGALDWTQAETDWLIEWQRRMFLAPEPEYPAINDLLQIGLTSATLNPTTTNLACTVRQWNDAIREAYRRGLEVGKKG
jgi:hypothetical protein